ncbi:THAP domain-containing protein 1 [Rhipicephalus sanguineus]|uniref:THAP domain-containing protein 1 n=1 Tax=Rhipicephalus sanguineus TaxID=34632 RepID=UPI0020C498E5|nr:THAP domain-containing protein 1 [Rhipicephalus sanguineus]
MPACCAFGCSTQSGKGLALFSVPLGKHDKTRRKAWLHRIGRKNFKPTKSSKLCERHFTDDQFEQTILRSFGTKKLKCSAVPSIFSHRPEKRPRKAPHPRGAGKQTVMSPAIVPLPGSDMLQPAAGVVPTLETAATMPSNDALHLSTAAVPVIDEAVGESHTEDLQQDVDENVQNVILEPPRESMTCASKSTQKISSASFSRNGLCSSEPPTKKMRLSILRDITVPVQSAVPCPKGQCYVYA